jgi:uncharacterized 2Fe-2S/4Fe-4S cluster protein (DUF4445 family)
MHHLLLGLPVRQLGIYPYEPVLKDSVGMMAAELGIRSCPGARVHMLPNVAGFIGSDHVAMIAATGLHATKAAVLGLDIGTNTEIVLACKGVLRSASCASGPALEGVHISSGMLAQRGAIERVSMDNGAATVRTIGKAAPLGLCGSGVIDAVAELVRTGIINRRGRFVDTPGVIWTGQTAAYMLVSAAASGTGEAIMITQKDIEELQLAKAAIRAGCEILLEQAGAGWDDIGRIILAGGFGSHVNISSAARIGIVPLAHMHLVNKAGNAAGLGAVRFLTNPSLREEAAAIAGRIAHIELAAHPRFAQIFARFLPFDHC